MFFFRRQLTRTKNSSFGFSAPAADALVPVARARPHPDPGAAAAAGVAVLVDGGRGGAVGRRRRDGGEGLGDLLAELGAEDAVDEDVDGRVEDEQEVAAVGQQVRPLRERLLAQTGDKTSQNFKAES